VALQDVAIVGVYTTEQATRLDRSSMDLCIEAAFGALEDAGLPPNSVDAVAMEWPGPGGYPGDSASWARLFGSPLRWTADGALESAGARAVAKAASAISAGLCEVAIVGGGMAGPEAAARFKTVGPGWEFAQPFGAYAASEFALVAQRHMYEFGTTPEQLAEVSATIRNHGHKNPDAVMFGEGPYTPDDVLASPVIASPLHRLDVCLIAQGGAALVMTTMERARDLRQQPVRLLGAGMEYLMGGWTGFSLYRQCGHIGTDAFARAFAMAGVGPEDIDVFSLYDPTSFEVIRQFEAMGLCPIGEGGPFVEGGTLSLEGSHPTNPDGGLLSFTWVGVQQMTMRVIEGVHQIRGQATGRQIDGAELVLASNAGSGAQHMEVAVLGPV